MEINISNRIKLFVRDGFRYKVLGSMVRNSPNRIAYHMQGNLIPNSNLKSSINDGGNIDFCGAANIERTDGDGLYFLTIKCKLGAGLSMRLNDVLSVNVDGHLINLQTDPSLMNHAEFNKSGEHFILEMYFFAIEKKILKLIADAIDVNFTISGEKQEIEGRLSKINIKRFTEFYYDYLEN